MKVSIITVVRNNAGYVGDCLRSVVRQSHGDIEHIVIDGGSTDGTMGIVNGYRDMLAVVLSEPDKGYVHAMNKGLALAKGDVVGFLHSDDFYAHNGVIEKVARVFEKTSAQALYGDLVYVAKDDTRRVIRYWRCGECSPVKVVSGWMPPHPTFFARRGVYERYGALDPGFAISADYELVLRFFYKHGISGFYLPEVLVNMRWGGASNRGIKNVIRKTREDYKACRMYGLGLQTVIAKNMRKMSQFFIR